MSDDEDESNKDGDYSMYASLGDLTLEVKGPDGNWVEETFESTWQKRLEEAGEMKEAIRDADGSVGAIR